ncbi:response regulator [candidate division KSB1 bacterium]|nr:response regulator [candidate division KSB1 bacterium]
MAQSDILIVEDENIVAMNIKKRLKNMGYAVSAVASSGQEALELSQKYQPDVILMDVRLKGDMDGVETAEKIHEQLNIPVIYLTAYSDEKMLQRAKVTEPFGYLLKPFEDKELNITIQMALYRHQMETKLRQERNLLRTVIDGTPDYIYVKDLKSRFLMCNTACKTLLQNDKPEDIAGKTDFHFFPKKRAAECLADEKKIFDTGQALINKEETVQDHAGNTRCVLTTKAPYRDGQGNIIGLVGISRDITERKRAERLLHALNEAALAIENAMTPDAVFEIVGKTFGQIDLSCVVFLSDDEEKELAVAFSNYDSKLIKFAEKLAGLRITDFKLDIESTTVFRQVVLDEKTLFIENAEEIASQLLPPKVKKLAGKLVRKMKIPKFIAAPLRIEEKVIGVLSVQSNEISQDDIPAITAFANQMAVTWHKCRLMQDLENSLSRLKRTQDQLIHSQKMEAIGRLAGGVAHDFNNLLTAIMGYTELLLNESRLDDSMRADLDEIKKASERAASLTRQLLAFSRRQPLMQKTLDLNMIVLNMNKLLRRLIGENIRLKMLPNSNINLIKADTSQVEQVILNLVVNARDAMPDGGEITIRTENVTVDDDYCKVISYARAGDFVCLSIEDTGDGMDKMTAEKIFDPYFSTKKSLHSAGLGLAVVYGIIKQHDGWINVYSQPGQGSVFKIYLPAVPLARIDEIEDNSTLKEYIGKGERILLVEDEHTIREFAKRVLLENGYKVVDVSNAQEAIDIFNKKNSNFDLLFSDVVLPDKSGLHLADKLSSEKPELKILLSSGYADQRSQWFLIRDRGYRFLQKPYVLVDLLMSIRDAILQK